MKTIGICGGANVSITLDTTIPYIGVDRGTETLLQQNITPIVAVGDFDSIGDQQLLQGIPVHRLPRDKDITDSEYALQYAIKEGYDRLLVYGVIGGRQDHFMAMLAVLQKYNEHSITLLDGQNEIFCLPRGTHEIENKGYRYFSIFTYHTTKISMHSCRYQVDNYMLSHTDPLCVSNEIVGSSVHIENDEDIIFMHCSDR